ncbi:DUF6339 family protein [Bacillus subtilis]|uniref:DUF6339 family protein n=2 Tax=Bacillus subtilis TaxID=1423 RepID=UPI003CCB1ED8
MRERMIRRKIQMKNSRSSIIIFNLILLAGLWWFGYITHDPDIEDPYELTKIMLQNRIKMYLE